MAIRPVPLRQSDLARYARAMRDAAVAEWRVIAHPDGRQEIIVGKPTLIETTAGWDDLE